MVIFQKRFLSNNRILYRYFIYFLFIYLFIIYLFTYLFFHLPLCLFVLQLFIRFESTNSVWSISLINGCWSEGNKVLVRIMEPKECAITGVYKKWHHMEFPKLYSLPNIFIMIKWSHWKWVGLAVCAKIRNLYKILVKRSEREKIPRRA